MGIPVTLSPSSKHTTMTSCIYLVYIIPRLLNFTLKYSRDKSHTRHLLFDCHSTVCTCARHIIFSIPHQSSLVNMAANHVHHLDKNLNDCNEHDIDWNLLPQSSSKPLFNQGNPFRILKSISVINRSPKLRLIKKVQNK